mmetsp:Transcript_47272/g.131715  ORF Transcript_47272/g.131715 Transcript_47272/m.131715 type:complete len:200 (+) Transcript_47272:121-720(+)
MIRLEKPRSVASRSASALRSSVVSSPVAGKSTTKTRGVPTLPGQVGGIELEGVFAVESFALLLLFCSHSWLNTQLHSRVCFESASARLGSTNMTSASQASRGNAPSPQTVRNGLRNRRVCVDTADMLLAAPSLLDSLLYQLFPVASLALTGPWITTRSSTPKSLNKPIQVRICSSARARSPYPFLKNFLCSRLKVLRNA